MERLVARARDTFGRIDILVNAAGITGPIETPVWEIKADDFDQVIAVQPARARSCRPSTCSRP